MKTRFILFRRNGVFYAEDTTTGKQTSLRTKDETEAKSLLNARNEANLAPETFELPPSPPDNIAKDAPPETPESPA